ncbi:MAG: putative exonuclease [Haloquadratum walsbyi J07HQW2]|uniref:Putative exonuclease n=1 Tax=Haloquadratum walsbyi J07HQW2 TaxID=1238425 RepID=U1NJ26_9EURY|nr:MAG: putative exonuclease [Haloquadratum walsbyi J07HQW2]
MTVSSTPSTLLPDSDAAAGTLLTVPGSVIREFDPVDVVSDAVAAVNPDVIIPVDPDSGVVIPALTGSIDVPVYQPGRGMLPQTVEAANENVTVVVSPSVDSLPDDPTSLIETEHGYVVTDALSLRIDPHDRQTRLDGLEAYIDTIDSAWIADHSSEKEEASVGLSYLSTGLRASYNRVVSTSDDHHMSIAGIGTSRARLGVGLDDSTQPLTVVSVFPNGAITTETISPDRFGLRGITGVSETRANHLRTEGFETRSAVATASPHKLTTVPSIGNSTAEQIHASATAVTDEMVVSTGDRSLPTGDPVFIDIETDGLAASTAWLIGVLDGSASSGNYLAFRQPGLNTPSAHLEAFMTWLTGSARGRPVVAWNGYGFDFDVIHEQLQKHCPSYLDDWENRYTFDPLYWGRTQGNAEFPGRTNKLEHVATALGWEPKTQGINGRRVAELYVDWRERMTTADNPETVSPPPWDRLEAYCEDDVRGLARIYEALSDADQARTNDASLQSGSDRNRDRDRRSRSSASTSQGSLSDFSS